LQRLLHREAAAGGSAHPCGVQRFGQRAAPALQTALAPFEFKTGKPHMSHRAQARSAASHLALPQLPGSTMKATRRWQVMARTRVHSLIVL